MDFTSIINECHNFFPFFCVNGTMSISKDFFNVKFFFPEQHSYYVVFLKKKKNSYYLVGKHGKARGEMEIPSQSKKNFKCSTLGFPIKFKHITRLNLIVLKKNNKFCFALINIKCVGI